VLTLLLRDMKLAVRAVTFRDVHRRGEDPVSAVGLRSDAMAELDANVEQELVALAIAMVKQLVRRELRLDPGEIIGVVREALSVLPVATRSVRLHLHPEDATLVREVLSLSDDEDRTWQIVEDPVLSRGGCRVVSETSRVDASVEARLNAVIAQALGGERGDD